MVQFGPLDHADSLSGQYRPTSFLRGYDFIKKDQDFHSLHATPLQPKSVGAFSLYTSDLPPPRHTPSPYDSDTAGAVSMTDMTSIKSQSASPPLKTVRKSPLSPTVHPQESSAREDRGNRLPGIAQLDRQMLTPWSRAENSGLRQSSGPLSHRWNPPSFERREMSYSNGQDRRIDEQSRKVENNEGSLSNAGKGTAYRSPRPSDRRPVSPDWQTRETVKALPSSPYARKGDVIEERRRSFEESNANGVEQRWRSGAYEERPSYRHEEYRAAPYDGRRSPLVAERGPLPPLSDRSYARDVRERSPPVHFHSSLGDGHYPRRSGNISREAYSSYHLPGHAHRSSSSSTRSLSMPYYYDRSQELVDPASGPYHHDDIAPGHRLSPGTHHSPRHHPYMMHGQIAYPSHDGLPGSPPNMPRRRGKLPKAVTDLLKTWLLDHAAHPYPTEDEKRRLCAATGLSISQVSNWFINARRRILVPQGSGHFGIGGAGAPGHPSGDAPLSPHAVPTTHMHSAQSPHEVREIDNHHYRVASARHTEYAAQPHRIVPSTQHYGGHPYGSGAGDLHHRSVDRSPHLR